MILPFIDQAPLYNQIDSETNGFANNWHVGFTGNTFIPSSREIIPAYICPSDPMDGINLNKGSFGKSNYGTERFTLGVNKKLQIRDMTDGTSNTIIVGEVSTRDESGSNGSCGGTACTFEGKLWIGTRTTASGWQEGLEGSDVYFIASADDFINGGTRTVSDLFSLSSVHEGGVHVLLGDGAVRFISENINVNTYLWLNDENDGNVIGEF